MRYQRTILFATVLALSLNAQAREGADPGRPEGPAHAGQGQAHAQAAGHSQAPGHAPSQAQASSRHRTSTAPAANAHAAKHERYRDLGIHRVPDHAASHPALREKAERSHIAFPHDGGALHHPNAKPFTRRAMASVTVHNHFREVMADRHLLADMSAMHREERIAGHYYWHRWQDMDYCHYYDRWGYHWYGWYLGSHFLWVRSFGGRFWWYDDSATRWCFWFNGDWWWPDPIHREVVYVYRDGDYVANDPGPGITSTPLPAPPGEAPSSYASPTPGGTAPYIDPKDMPPAPEELPPLPAPEKL